MPIIDWTSVAVGVLGGGVGVEIVRQTFRRLWPVKKITAAQAIMAQIDVHRVLTSLVEEMDAYSAVLVESQNGPALQRPGQVMYVTVTSEALSDGAIPTQQRWLNVPVDAGFHLALRELINSPSGIIYYDTIDWPSPAIRDMYAALDVAGAFLIRVDSKPNIIRYIAVRFKDRPELCRETNETLRSHAAEIGNILHRHD